MVIERAGLIVGVSRRCETTEHVVQMDGNIQTACFKNLKCDV